MEKNKKILSICLIFLLTFSTIAMLTSVSAHTPPWTIPTYAYISITPPIQQVNNWVQVVFWINTVAPTAGGLGGDRWHGLMVNITEPDGTKSQLGPYDSNQLGGYYAIYTPTKVGNYSFQFYWPGQIATNGTGIPNYQNIAYVGDYFQPAASEIAILQVQQDPIPTWQNTPTPTDYWTLPINSVNRDTWGHLASNWLGNAWLRYNYQTAGQAPTSAHILWQTPMVPGFAGGIIDAQWSGWNTAKGDYEGPLGSYGSGGYPANAGFIIMNGIIYYSTPQVATTAKYGYYAKDLYTGETLWYNNGSSIPNDGGMTLANPGSGGAVGPAVMKSYPKLSFGQLYQYYGANGAGVCPYLWAVVGTTWHMLDASTGNWILTIKNVPSGTMAMDQDGSLLLYRYDSATGRLYCWNSSQSIRPSGPTGTAQEQWKPPVGTVIDAQNDTTWATYQPIPTSSGIPVWTANQVMPRSGYTMNVTIPSGLPGSISAVLQDSQRVPQQLFAWTNPSSGQGITGGNGNFQAWLVKINYHQEPYSPYPNETFTQNNNLGYTATLLWNKTYDPPATGNLTYYLNAVSYEDQVYTIYAKETRQLWGYSLEDGSLLWGPTPMQSSIDSYSYAVGTFSSVAYGNVYRGGYAGNLYCYDIKTGELKWTFTATGIATESPYGNYPLNYIGGICDGKIYVYGNLGYVNQPNWRGMRLYCIDAYTGEEIWSLLNWPLYMGIADGYIVEMDQYNYMINCIGKGPSTTTVTATPGLGNAITIQGLVIDQSTGAKELVEKGKINVVPAVSEESMEQWMEYLYSQQAMPTNATGVPVTLFISDQNNNLIDTIHTASDISGHYAASWTPATQGLYTITAAFDGSISYGASTAVTSISIGALSTQASSTPTVTPTQTVEPSTTVVPTTSPSTAPLGSGISTETLLIVGAAVVIVIAVITAAVVLRRRK